MCQEGALRGECFRTMVTGMLCSSASSSRAGVQRASRNDAFRIATIPHPGNNLGASTTTLTTKIR
jgi:hypothetical protein